MPRMDEHGKAVSPKTHDITFDHVSFSYENKQILHDINVTLPDKTTTAIVGPSGSGKSTLCNLIARFWDVDSGCVKIGGARLHTGKPDESNQHGIPERVPVRGHH